MSEQDRGPGSESESADPDPYERLPSSPREDESHDPGTVGSEGTPPTEADERRAERAATRHGPSANMLPGRPSRRFGLERALVRLVATGGVIGIGVGIAAILGANNVQAWIIGLVVSALSVLLSAILWSSRQL